MRTARFGAVGAFVQTTLLHTYLTHVVPRIRLCGSYFSKPSHHLAAKSFLRLAVHLGTLLPFRIGIIFFSLSTLQHLSFQKGLEGLKAKYWDGLRAAYCYWPPVLLSMYMFVPRHYGNLFYDVFNLFWAVALSYFASLEVPEQHTNESSLVEMKGKDAQDLHSKLEHKQNFALRPPLSYAESKVSDEEDGKYCEFKITPRLPSERREVSQKEPKQTLQ